MAMAYFLPFLYSQLLVTPALPQVDLVGQTYIVTGANVGLGLECARHLTRMNATKVVLAVRTISKGESAKQSIEESTGKRGVVEVWSLDLSSYDSVKAFVKQAQGLDRLDAIIENAGIATTKYRVAEDNESTITVNVVSTFLLALMILPKLRETALKFNITPRLSIISSEVHAFTTLAEKSSPSIFEKANAKDADMKDRYNVSKLMEVLYCRELATQMKKNGNPQVILNITNPGLCISELAKPGDAPTIFFIFRWIFGRSTHVGARTLVAAAVAGAETHGEYMSDGKIACTAKFVRSEEGVQTQRRVWEELNAKLEKIQPGVLENV